MSVMRNKIAIIMLRRERKGRGKEATEKKKGEKRKCKVIIEP